MCEWCGAIASGFYTDVLLILVSGLCLHHSHFGIVAYIHARGKGK